MSGKFAWLRFPLGLETAWKAQQVGGGTVTPVENALRLTKPAAPGSTYINAQIDDYQQLRRKDFLWRPPLTLTVRARFSHESCSAPEGAKTPSQRWLSGTAGFGFWNDPFMMTGRRIPTLPRALWFFYSAPPSNISLAHGVAGFGWKAATIDARSARFLILAPTAPIAIPLMRVRTLYQLLWPIAQRAIGVCEAPISSSLTNWHTYVIKWDEKSVCFYVDEECVLLSEHSPRGPLGLVLWIDNQYMIMTPNGKFGQGTVASGDEEFLEIQSVSIS